MMDEVLGAVECLNDEAYERNPKYVEECGYPWTYSTDVQAVTAVEFMGTAIWDSESDDRPDIDEDGNKVNLVSHLRKQALEMADDIRKLVADLG